MHTSTKYKILRFSLVGGVIGLLYGNIEFLIDSQTIDVEPYWPLQLRATSVGLMVGAASSAIEHALKEYFRKRPFIFLVIARAVLYTILISICLTIVNGIWFMVNGDPYSVMDQFGMYFFDRMYLINLSTVFIALVLAGSLDQINSLHSRGELLRFMSGRYHTPREVDRIFCFIDLKGSTTITENLGDLQYANFLRDYFSDISDAIRTTKAEIYQFVGDEIVLCWTIRSGTQSGNCIHCPLIAHRAIQSKKEEYLNQYGHVPEFRAGIHIGKCIVTWVGEVRREIVYIGDVLNTASRIQEQCKVHSKDIMVSEPLLEALGDLHQFKTHYVDDIIPRGKEQSVRIWSVDLE